jgi:2-phospho-L-lactate/phosphoenolpyruvate guanylyltransferase
MRTLAILPIKSFGAAKQRLSGRLGGGWRQALAQAMFSDVITALGHVPELEEVAVVTANPVAAMASHRRGVRLLHDPTEDGQSAAAQIGIAYAVEAGYDRVLCVPGDTPLLDPGELSALLAREGQPSVTIVPDRHGTGTNALLLRPPTAIAPSFGPDSLARHTTAAQEAGASFSVEPLPSLVLDIDTPDDLDALRAMIEQRRGMAPATNGALRQLERSGAVGATASRPPAAAQVR